ncbi:hypothetical protein [Corynebacterium auris]|uniref:hypothetical protein n=1 Tax=Corynebacterium auris TaxID=44750 RepID=UPI0025B4143B|nr:hypothetical protein [Corynebacterium auris]WJY69140.1 hypothetical protein CAURIS_11370 [Corynebacterium auris]
MRRAPRVCAAALAGALTFALVPAAGGIAIPTNPDNPAVAELWVNPNIRPGEGERATVELVAGPESIAAHDPVNVTLRVTNTSNDTLTGLSVTPRRGPATGSPEDQRAAAIADIGEYSVVGRPRDVDKQLAPGESTELDLEILEDELPLPGLATYPLMFALADEAEVLDTERFHLDVHGEDAGPAPGLTALFPLSAPIDIVPGETGQAPETPPLVLASESLAGELAEGGRLSSLLDVYDHATSDPAVASATCLAIDPALVDTAERMSRGYTVAPTRPDIAQEPQRLRDSWGSDTATPDGEAGRGSADAQAWLERLAAIAAERCILALPWANADLNAVARTGDVWLMREAVERGPFTLGRVLDATGLLNVVLPAAGYVDAEAAPGVGWADHMRSTVPTGGMSGAWDAGQAQAGTGASRRVEGEQRTTLDRQDLPGAGGVAAPEPQQPVRALVASGTVGGAEEDRFAWLAPGVLAVEYQDALASTLAEVGPHPETTGYSRPWLRSTLEDDSPAARAINAASGVRLAVRASRFAAGEGAPEPVLVNPPASWDPASAATIMEAVRNLVATTAWPMTLSDYLAAPAQVPAATSSGSPHPDPTVYADSEILAAGQQASFINDLSALLVDDPAITLTRYEATLPLRRDLLVALGATGRRSREFYPAAERATRERLAGSRDMLNTLRSSVTLIPPGNVYTRASSSSPLVIVAQNGLPLPVDTQILYTGPEGARLHVPQTLRIPARGSYTVQMTADLPDDAPTNLQLFLASPNSVPISQPVDISVRTVGIETRGRVILGALAVALAMLLLFTVGRRRRARGPTSLPPPGNGRHTEPDIRHNTREPPAPPRGPETP